MKRKIICLLGITLAFIMVLCACSDSGKQESAGKAEKDNNLPVQCSLKLSPDEFPEIDGATALAPYYEAMAAAMLDIPVEEARKYVRCSTTDGAFSNLISGDADMIFCSLPSEDQVKEAAEQDVEFYCTPFLNGGFVFFVNKDNPVDSLTVDQLHDIYAGKITNWKDVGGDDEEIIAYQRSEGSGSQTGMYRFIIPQNEIMKAPQERMIEDMGGIVDAVASYKNSEGAIGYSYYYYVANMHYNDRIKLLAIDGIIPGDDTIADGTYPLINQSQVIIRKSDADNEILRKIIDWITSEEGQKLGEANGYVRNADL